MSPHGRMYKPPHEHQRTILLSASLSERLQQNQTQKDIGSRNGDVANADIKDSAAILVDSKRTNNKSTTKNVWEIAMTAMTKIYFHAARTITCINPEDEQRYNIKLSRRTIKAISFGFACMCATQLVQRPSGRTKTETNEIEQPRGGVSLKFGNLQTLLNVLQKNYASLIECVHIPSFPSSSHPHLLLTTSVLFAFPITYLRYANRSDRYQDEIIVGGILLLILVASMTGNVWETAISLLPWSIIIGLGLSSLLHWGFSSQEKNR